MKGGTELIYRYSGACVRACVRAYSPKEKKMRNKKRKKEKKTSERQLAKGARHACIWMDLGTISGHLRRGIGLDVWLDV